MHPTARSAIPGLVVIATMFATPPPATADAIVTSLARDTPIAAYGGVAAWSEFDAPSGRYRLVLRHGRANAAAPIAAARAPFDVSLGPDGRGRVVALYTRCRTATRDCDVYRYEVDARRERRLATLSSPSRDEAWPVQWGDRVAFVRRARAYVSTKRSLSEVLPDPRGKRGGGTLTSCDEPFVTTLSSRAAPRRLDRGFCAKTNGMSIRGSSIVQVTSFGLDFNAGQTQVRRLHVRGGRVRVLARGATGLGGFSPFASPSQSASAVWLTRIGNRDPHDFLRIDLRTARLTSVRPNLLLAGAVARDDRGTFWYVERPEPLDEDSDAAQGYPPFCGTAPQPCRLVRASASPFSGRARTLPAQLRPAQSSLDILYPDPTEIAGRLTTPVVRGATLVRREPLAGVMVELARTINARGELAPTGLTTLTDASGRWSFARAEGPASAEYVVVDRATQSASGLITVYTFAKVTLAAAGSALSGAVIPAAPARRVSIQRVKTDATGHPLGGCDPFGGPVRPCTEDRWTTVAEVALDQAGAFTAAVGAPGYYRADLQSEGAGLLGYVGRSSVIQVP